MRFFQISPFAALCIFRLGSILATFVGSPYEALAQSLAEEEGLKPGLVANYWIGRRNDSDESSNGIPNEEPIGKDVPLVTRIETIPSLDWNLIASEVPVTAPLDGKTGPLEVRTRLRGLIFAGGDLQFHTFSSGFLSVKISNKQLIRNRSTELVWSDSKTIKLDHDWHEIDIEFRSIADSSSANQPELIDSEKQGANKPLATRNSEKPQRKNPPRRFSLFWSSKTFPLEPVPPRLLAHDVEENPTGNNIDNNTNKISVGSVIAKRLLNFRRYQRGQDLVRALRCQACHEVDGKVGQRDILAAPNLSNVARNIDRNWLVEMLATSHSPATQSIDADKSTFAKINRMPGFAITINEANAIADYFLGADSENHEGNKKMVDQKKRQTPAPKPKIITQGKVLFNSSGCLACHQVTNKNGELGVSNLFDGGDLSAIGSKRSHDSIKRLLKSPAAVNADHRMPAFSFPPQEIDAVSAYLASLTERRGNSRRSKKQTQTDKKPNNKLDGKSLVRQYNCAACHQRSDWKPLVSQQKPNSKGDKTEIVARRSRPLTDQSAWRKSCAGSTKDQARSSNQPRYNLSPADQGAIQIYVTQTSKHKIGTGMPSATAWLNENNCLSCHTRNGNRGLANTLTKLGQQYPEQRSQIPAYTAPSLNSVGDKLQPEVFREILLKGSGHSKEKNRYRPWLDIQMPRYRIDTKTLDAILRKFAVEDRIPPRTSTGKSPDTETKFKTPPKEEFTSGELQIAGEHLVTTSGFGCTSCHAIGNRKPPKAPLRALGPNLSSIGTRVRRSWFDRWVQNPTRIVSNMEMPSLKVAADKTLDNDLPSQIDAMWQVLNQKDFTPPVPDALRTVAKGGDASANERASILTDVIRFRGKTSELVRVKPFLIALPNRHNVLFDLERGKLDRWWTGDAAAQQTEGKTWFWEQAGTTILNFSRGESKEQHEFLLDGQRPVLQNAFVTEAEQWTHTGRGKVEFASVLDFGKENRRLRIKQEFAPKWPGYLLTPEGEVINPNNTNRKGRPAVQKLNGFVRGITLPPFRGELTMKVLPDAVAKRAKSISNTKELRARFDEPLPISIQVIRPSARNLVSHKRGTIVIKGNPGKATQIEIHYNIGILPAPPVSKAIKVPAVRKIEKLNVVPGFQAFRLPLNEIAMPTAIAWRPDGKMLISSLKGRVWLASDLNRDGFADHQQVYSDELAAPFGLHATNQYVDIINKYGLLRHYDDNGDGRADRVETVASGWGHTTDYHDWAVGLPSDGKGGYYMSLACQQDNRTSAEAHLRGTVIHLVPKVRAEKRESEGTGNRNSDLTTNTRSSRVEFETRVVSEGHRFPIGIARNTKGQLFVTDNQGNYNPFNELNHVQQGKHFGFINKLDQKKKSPEPTPPAIEIHHPWTRSVNGICFLERDRRGETTTIIPRDSKTLSRPDLPFGPFTGHLIGCEYDSRRLIRMSLQEVNGTIQGAAYPFSYDEPRKSQPLQGPLCCAVSPLGDLFVGSIRDSGWGAGNNIGSIVRLRFQPNKLPAGIAEVRATSVGFIVRFTKPVDPEMAKNPENYLISSFTRKSTPAYGGANKDLRRESIRSVAVADDGMGVVVSLRRLRPNYVYEIRLKPLIKKAKFFPALAYYTLREIPK